MAVVYTSPKRKRDAPNTTATTLSPLLDDGDEARTSPPRLRLDSSSSPALADQQQLPGNGSPGGKVTSRFEGLQLAGDGTVGALDWGVAAGGAGVDRTRGHSDTTRKRAKQMNGIDGGVDGFKDINGTQRPVLSMMGPGGERSLLEGGDDTQRISRIPTDEAPGGQSAQLESKESRGLESAFEMPPQSTAGAGGELKSPPRSKSPPLHNSDNAALTWQEHEITGQNVDDPDDDGEGVNGIGFKPTAAMAYARAERRRQQVQEYKSREAREARRVRSERRTRERGVEKALEKEQVKRRVRFLEEAVIEAGE
ncbi:MAG: hypothetical protein M1837_005177 [Sclerophora amabilis]|nr:MAG: hypothetical protein M1837_005177 [Sclerophora amabilis]